jgi:hypothetical protein
MAGTKFRGLDLKEEDTIGLRYLFLVLPTVISYYLRNDLGTEKLQVALRAADNEPAAVGFMRASLLMDLRSGDYGSNVSKFVKS